MNKQEELQYWYSEDDRPYENRETPFSREEIEEFTKEVEKMLIRKNLIGE